MDNRNDATHIVFVYESVNDFTKSVNNYTTRKWVNSAMTAGQISALAHGAGKFARVIPINKSGA